MNDKLDSKNLVELERYLAPKGAIVDKLPNAKDTKDLAEVYIINSTGAYDTYRMLKGKWVLTNSNLHTIETITTGGGSGGSGVDYSAPIAVNTANIVINADAIAALVNLAPSYVETSVDYTLPTAVGVDKQIIAVKNTHASNILTLDCFGAETIDSETSQDFGPDDCIMVMSNNTNWIIV